MLKNSNMHQNSYAYYHQQSQTCQGSVFIQPYTSNKFHLRWQRLAKSRSLKYVVRVLPDGDLHQGCYTFGSYDSTREVPPSRQIDQEYYSDHSGGFESSRNHRFAPLDEII